MALISDAFRLKNQRKKELIKATEKETLMNFRNTQISYFLKPREEFLKQQANKTVSDAPPPLLRLLPSPPPKQNAYNNFHLTTSFNKPNLQMYHYSQHHAMNTIERVLNNCKIYKDTPLYNSHQQQQIQQIQRLQQQNQQLQQQHLKQPLLLKNLLQQHHLKEQLLQQQQIQQQKHYQLQQNQQLLQQRHLQQHHLLRHHGNHLIPMQQSRIVPKNNSILHQNTKKQSLDTSPFPIPSQAIPFPTIPNNLSPFHPPLLKLERSSLKPSTPPPFLLPRRQFMNREKAISQGLCTICGDRASGYHYNAYSCEGCKGFFRRTVMKRMVYKCKLSSGHCEMDMWMRRKCPACRLKRCYEEGMREECMLTPNQCWMRRCRKRIVTKRQRKYQQKAQENPSEVDEFIMGEDILEQMEPEQKNFIKLIVDLHNQYEMPNEKDLKLLSNPADKKFENENERIEALFVFNMEMTVLVTRLIVQFTKSLPGFKNLNREDQVVLLKASSSEVRILRAARRYDMIVLRNNMPFKHEIDGIGMKGAAEGMLEFSRAMSKLSVDNSEYALLLAICIFSPRQGLKEALLVERLQVIYTELLTRYIRLRRGKFHRVQLAQLLMMMTTLRTIGWKHNQFLCKLSLRNGSLPPILNEYFDI